MKESLRDKVYKELLDKMIRCEFKPNSFITEDRLIEEAGTSRTPVREALHKLEEDRFVKIFPKRGIYITELTTKSLREVYEVRKLTEPFIIRTYGYRIPAEKAEALKESVRSVSGDHEQADAADCGLFSLILGACANEHLTHLAVTMYRHSRRLLTGTGLEKTGGNGQETSGNERFLQFILDRQFEEAASFRAEMLDEEEQRIMSAMFKRDGNNS